MERALLRHGVLAVVLASLALGTAPARADTGMDARTPRSAEYEQKKAKIAKGDSAGFVKLAEWARKTLLFEEEKEALVLAVRANADDKAALEKLNAVLATEKLHHDMANPWRREANVLYVETNTTEAKLYFFCDSVVAFWNRFSKDFNLKKNPVEEWGKKVAVKIFKSREDFNRYRQEAGDGTKESAVGYYTLRRHELVLFDDPDQPQECLDTLFHEGCHLFTNLLLGNRTRLPIWLSEGMAEYFGTARLLAEKKDLDCGLPNYMRIEEARRFLDKNQVKLDDLLRTRPQAFGSEHYALAWALIHMLVEKKKDGKHPYREKFVQFFSSVTSGTSATSAFTECFGPTDRIEKEWLAYIKEFPLPPFQVGLNLLARRQPEQAIVQFLKHLKENPKDATGQFSLGDAYFMEKDYDKAEEAYRATVALQPTHATAHAMLSIVLSYRGDIPGALEHALRAVEIAPTGTNLYCLANAYRLSGKKAEAKAALADCVRLWGEDDATRKLAKAIDGVKEDPGPTEQPGMTPGQGDPGSRGNE